MIDHKDGDKKETVTYEYDKAGNRIKKAEGNVQTAYTYNGLDQLLTAVTERNGEKENTVTYEYDVKGNQVKESDSKSQVTTVNEYDAENRLSKAVITMPLAETLPDSASGLSVETAPEAGSTDQIKTITQENLYNGNGQRIRKSEGAKETHYFYQDGVVSNTTEGNGDTKAVQNLLGLEENVIMAESDGLEYHLYNKDIQGSTTSVLDADGTGELSYEYDDFGETEINGNSAFQNEICYTGRIYDETTGLYYLNARYYDPESGRFLTEDTYRGELKEPDTLHLYVYCKNNPINYVDPSGHVVISIGFKAEAAAVIGAYAMLSFNTDFKYLTMCIAAGMKIITNVAASFGVVVTCFAHKNVNGIKGWGFSTGISFCVGVKINASIGVDVTSNGKLIGHVSGGVAKGVSIAPIPYWDTEFGYTSEKNRWKLSSISKKKKNYCRLAQKFSLQKKKGYIEIQRKKRKICIDTKKKKVTIR